MINALRHNYDFAVFGLVVFGFVFVASQRLGTVPVCETDESFTLQVPYEMLNRGKIALPMYRYLGGNIENVWHSYTPVYFVLLSGFLKTFGFGLLQGRAFNLITALLTLLMVYLMGRKLFDWRVGLIAVTMLVSDQTFLERSRLIRNDYAAAMFALLAFYLCEVAEERRSGRLFFASGLAAGAGVMCHTNVLYMLGVICVLILFREGRRVFSSKKLYLVAGGAFAVMAYEIVYDLIDLKNFRLQNRQDTLHFQVLEGWGWLENLWRERLRYLAWYDGGALFPTLPRTLLHLFQLLTVIAVIYLIVRSTRRIRVDEKSDPHGRILLVTAAVTLFIAILGGNKEIYYIAHLAPWFALCVGVLLRDGLELVFRLLSSPAAWAKPVRLAASVAVVIAITAYGYQLAKQNKRYVTEVRNPDLVSFDEIKAALREVVPRDLCPVAIKAPVIWLAFPEKDQCFADIESRMAEAVDIDGKDYALISRTRNLQHLAGLAGKFHLLGELTNTPYGSLVIYYTGTDPRYLKLSARRYHFFNGFGGHVSDEQIAQAREVWSATDLSGSAKMANPSVTDEGLAIESGQGKPGENTFTELCSVELKPSTAYELVLDSKSSEEWEAVVIEETTGHWIKQIELSGGNRINELFRTFAEKRVRILVRALTHKSGDPLYVSRMSIREISEL